ncbi:hypothetical protein DPMN_052088 [Dreissena polymorpha]|uniref:Uncharacterized protein n=1 Tax=Dreissena polymorpha TaxID=45954 RepID=A0A9D4CL25_DREPO|nr:hypothetical protein DPMN_052088 [Dreissena polymorpha]
MLSAEFLKLAFSSKFSKNTIRIANSLDPDETPRSVVSHLDPNCLQRPSKFGSSTERAKGELHPWLEAKSTHSGWIGGRFI